MDTLKVVARQAWCEKNLGASEALVTNQNFSAVRKFIILFAGVRVFGVFHGLVIIANDYCHSLLNVSYNFELGRCRECQASLLEDLTQVLSQITTSQQNFLDCVGDGVTFVDGDSM